MLHEVELNSLDVSNLLWDIQKTCVSSEDVEHFWEIKQVWLVKNKELEERYEKKRKLMKSLGRTDLEVQDDLLFTAEGQRNVQLICESGPRCHEKKNNVLGDTQYGIHMNRHYDILTRFMVFKNFQQANYIVISRAMLGRVKKVKPFLTGEYGCIAPTPNYDCHVAEDDLDLTSMDLTDAIAYNFVYMYEYDEESILPMSYPRHVLPIAVLRLQRTRNRLVRPKYMRERDLKNIKTKKRLQNETKPMKQLPRSAPHKTYFERGRRHGTKLISDVPIEPPTEKLPSETMSKLEKFRRPSFISGGTGMSHLFFKRPFSKMPLTWKKMFRFNPKKKPTSKPSLNRRWKGRRSRSSSREPKHRQRSRSRSPVSASKSRDKNLFEIFDRSSPDRKKSSTSSFHRKNNSTDKSPREKTSNVKYMSGSSRGTNKMSPVRNIDTGCKYNVQNASGNSTIMDDDRTCNSEHKSVSSNNELVLDSGSKVKHNSKHSNTCNDEENSQTVHDDQRMRSSVASKSYTPENTRTSMEGSPNKELLKGQVQNHDKTPIKTQDKHKEQNYQLVRITFDEPNTPSIYHVSRGICVPKEDNRKVKDPRLLRAMGCVVEVPVMAGFGPFLRRIKEEPPEDENYGKSSEKYKNILPVESIKTEPQDEETEDDVEKVLKELDNAIKAIQNKSGEETFNSVDKHKKDRMESCEHNTTQIKVKREIVEQTKTVEGQEHRTEDFHPRNMGFSSYLPEYNDKDDFERTARVLTEVFGDGESSPNKKVPMTMSDYFGSSNPNVSISTTNETNIEHQLSDINLSCEPRNDVHMSKENQEKEKSEDYKCKTTKLPTKEKSSEIFPESKKKNKRSEKDSARSPVKEKPLDNKQNVTSDKEKTNKSYVQNKESYRDQSRSRSPQPRPRSRSPSSSHMRNRKPDKKRKRSRSRSVNKNDQEVDRPKSYSTKKKRVEKRNSRSPHLQDTKSSRGRPDKHNSRERRSRSKSNPARSKSVSSHDSGTRYKSTSGSKISNDSTRKSKAEEIYKRETSPGRLRYLEERRRKIENERRLHSPNNHYKRVYSKRIEESDDNHSMEFSSTPVKSDDDMDFYDHQRSSYVDLTKETEFQRFPERRPTATNDEAVVNTTLSKAMTSLLKKIVFRDNSNHDDSAEGRMADMVIELVKDQMSKEIKPTIVPTPSVSSPLLPTPTVHPFVPYLKQERSMEDLYSSTPWEPAVSSSRGEMSGGRVEYDDDDDDYVDEPYTHDEPLDIPSTSYTYHTRESQYTQRVHTSYPLSDGYIDPHSGAFKGKLYTMKTVKKIRGGSYRGRFTSSRGSYRPRGFRGGYRPRARARGRGYPSHTVTSYHHSYRGKSSYNEDR
ncbi:uncharacterized protein LOC111119854 isoform X4 [Crassostrea virginica]